MSNLPSLRDSSSSLEGARVEFPAGEFPAPGDGRNTMLEMCRIALHERRWHALVAFLVVATVGAINLMVSKPQYEAAASIQVLRHAPSVLRGTEIVDNNITTEIDFNTQIKLLESGSLLHSVVDRLTPDELRDVVEPFKTSSGPTPSAFDIVAKNRTITPVRYSFVVVVRYRHPNPKIAARVANLIASEYISFNTRLRIEESMKVVDDLKERADQQRKRVDEIAKAEQAFRERGNLVSLVQSKDIVTEKLKALNIITTDTQARLRDAEIRWTQVQEWTKDGRDLSELPFIAIQPKVAQLLAEITRLKLTQAQLTERYNAKHPRMIEAVQSVAQAEAEMKFAVESAAASTKAEYENARRANEESRDALAAQETRSLEVDRSAVEYDNLERDFRVNNQLLEAMIARIRESSVTGSIEVDTARIVDQASEPNAPVSPNVPLRIGVTLVLGVLAGLGLALAASLIDDRVTSVYDVESVIGLPVIGLIPRVAKMESEDRAKLALSGEEPVVAEAFLTLYSTLRVGHLSNSARTILVTSTLPGEGKSFVASNLALTFAAQGQRTVIVDCDLRKPTIQRTYDLGRCKGIIEYYHGTVPLETVVQKNVKPNLDVVVAGNGHGNAIEILNSPEFLVLLKELAGRYDRVVLDTPPLGIVSDALNLLPLVNGAIYTMKFNGVDRRSVRRCIQQLRGANRPILGAVLNDMTVVARNVYYGHGHSKAVKAYYQSRLGNAEPAA